MGKASEENYARQRYRECVGRKGPERRTELPEMVASLENKAPFQCDLGKSVSML